jgi:peptidoglycan/LPS O-acetylase OafA/YrhL
MALDFTRFAAAVAVAFGHLTGEAFSVGWKYRLGLALDGVAIFFVLSGFVIRLVTTARPVRVRDYAIDRASRIYSVVLPAVTVTLLVLLIVHTIPPIRPLHESLRGELSIESIKALGAQIAANLTFTAEAWGLDLPVSFNSVFWSLSYECTYYAIYGIAFFGRGKWRVISLAALCALMGPPIVSMLPLWLLGCWIHDLYQKLRHKPGRGILLVTGAVAAIMAVGLIARTFLHGAGPALHHAAVTFAGPAHEAARRWNLHLLMRASPRFYMVGVPAAVIILIVLLALERTSLVRTSPVVRITRSIADGTFSLYLLHLPLLVLAAAYLPYDHSSSWQKIAVLMAIIILCTLAELRINRLKNWMRRAAAISPSATRKVVS